MDLSSTFFVFPVVVSALGLLAVVFQVKNSRLSSKNPLTAFGYVFVALSLVGALGSGAYAWSSEQSLRTTQQGHLSQIAGLKSQLDLAAKRDQNFDFIVSELTNRVEVQSKSIVELKAINAALVDGNEALSSDLASQSRRQQQAMQDQTDELERQTRIMEDQERDRRRQQRDRETCNLYRNFNMDLSFRAANC